MHLALIVGLLLMSAAGGLDVIVRLRMRRAGEQNVFFRGLTLDYRRYLRVRTQSGWSAWPLYLEFPLFVLGFVLVLIGIANM
jgi:hypothetical protein